MPTLTIRRLDGETHERLKRLAATHERSVEAEVRDLLKQAVAADRSAALTLFDAIRRRNARRARSFDAGGELRRLRDRG